MRKLSIVVFLSVIFTFGLCYVPSTRANGQINGAVRETHELSREKPLYETTYMHNLHGALEVISAPFAFTFALIFSVLAFLLIKRKNRLVECFRLSSADIRQNYYKRFKYSDLIIHPVLKSFVKLNQRLYA